MSAETPSGLSCPECETEMLSEGGDVRRCPECDTVVRPAASPGGQERVTPCRKGGDHFPVYLADGSAYCLACHDELAPKPAAPPSEDTGAPTPETIRCARCRRECEPVNDSDAPVTLCTDCAALQGDGEAPTPEAAYERSVLSAEKVDWHEHFPETMKLLANADLGAALREALPAKPRGHADSLTIWPHPNGAIEVWQTHDGAGVQNDATRALAALLRSSPARDATGDET